MGEGYLPTTHYMNDIVVLAMNRWSLRRNVRRLKQWFSEYGFDAHPEKTFIGKTEKGFDWMGEWLTGAGVTGIAPREKSQPSWKGTTAL